MKDWETLRQAMSSEVKQETGLDLEPERFTWVMALCDYHTDRLRVNFQMVFLAVLTPAK